MVCDGGNGLFRGDLHVVVGDNRVGIKRVREEHHVALCVNHPARHDSDVHSVRHVRSSEVLVGVHIEARAEHHRRNHARLAVWVGVVAEVKLIYERLPGAIERGGEVGPRTCATVPKVQNVCELFEVEELVLSLYPRLVRLALAGLVLGHKVLQPRGRDVNRRASAERGGHGVSVTRGDGSLAGVRVEWDLKALVGCEVVDADDVDIL